MGTQRPQQGGQYDAYGRIHVIKRGSEILIRSRYTRGALTAIGISLGVLLMGAILLAAVSIRMALSRHHPDPQFFWRYWFLVLPIALGAALVLVWGLGYFWRKDELFITNSECSLTTYIPFRRTQRRSIDRTEMVKLMITHATFLHGLRLELVDGGMLFYSHHDLDVVRGAAEFLKPLLNVPVEESPAVRVTGTPRI